MAARRQWRRDAVLEVAARYGARAVRMGRSPSFSWYTGGGDNRVDRAAERGVAELVVTRDAEWILTTNIEADRIRDEEASGIDVVDYPWWDTPEAAVRSLVGDDVVSDVDAKLDQDIAGLRLMLDAEAQAQYRGVGRDATAALDEAVAALDPSMTEWDAAATLSAACRTRGLLTPVLLVAGSSRLARYRHPLPTHDLLQQRALLVVCAERHGLYANASRIVAFDDDLGEHTRGDAACAELLSEMRSLTEPGRTLGDLFAQFRALYDRHGYADEWRNHHQGGLTGYRSREVVATPHSTTVVETGQAFAWNPSVRGSKAEETFVLTEDGPEVVAS